MKLPKCVRSGNRALVIGCVAVSMLLAACGSGSSGSSANTTQTTTGAPGESLPEALIEGCADEPEGDLLIYAGWVPEKVERIVEGFKSYAPGVSVEWLRGTSAEMQPRLDQERQSRSRGADVYIGANPPYMVSVEEDGDWGPIRSPHLDDPELTKFEHLHPTENSVVVGAEAYYIVWNTTLVTEPLLEYSDITDRADELGNGALGVPDLTADSVAQFYKHIEDDLGDGFMEELLSLDPTLYAGGVPLGQSVAAGETKVGIYIPGSTFDEMIAAGAPVDGSVPQEGLHTANFMGAIPEYAENECNAQFFLHWLLSPEGQEVAHPGAISVRDGIPGTVGGADAILYEVRPEVLSAENFQTYQSRFQAAR